MQRLRADTMSVSVIIATNKRPESLSVCLSHLLPQVTTHDEVIVVINSAGTYTPAGNRKNTSVVYLTEPKKGASWARNTGFRHVTKEGVAFLDDDSFVAPDWLSQIKWTLRNDRKKYPRAVYQGHATQKYTRRGKLEDLKREKFFRDATASGMGSDSAPGTRLVTLLAGNMFSYRSVFAKLDGPFHAEMFPFIGEQDDLAYRCIVRHIPLLFAPSVKVIHTTHRVVLAEEVRAAYSYGRAAALFQRLYFADREFTLSYYLLTRSLHNTTHDNAFIAKSGRNNRYSVQAVVYEIGIRLGYLLGYTVYTLLPAGRLHGYPVQ